MSPEFEKKLNFESDTFDNVRRDMNFVLQRLLGNMVEKGSTEGSMTLKLDVSFATEYIPNFNPQIEGESRKIEKPKFKHKVTSAVQIKDEKSGNLDSEMELVFDEVTGEWIMRPVADTAQRTIFDADFRETYEDAECVNDEAEEDGEPALPGRKIAALPGPTENEPECEESAGEEIPRESEEPEDITDELLEDTEPLPFGEGDDDYDYEEPQEEE